MPHEKLNDLGRAFERLNDRCAPMPVVLNEGIAFRNRTFRSSVR